MYWQKETYYSHVCIAKKRPTIEDLNEIYFDSCAHSTHTLTNTNAYMHARAHAHGEVLCRNSHMFIQATLSSVITHVYSGDT